MRMQLVLVGVAVVGLLSGCDTIPPGAERGPHGTMAYNVPISSDPPGVRIQANGQDVGMTPLTLKIFGDPDGTFHDFGSYEYVIQALPNATNQFVQTAVYRTGHMLTPEDRVPQQIHFDMFQPPPQPPNYGAAPAPGPYPVPAPYPYPYYYGPPAYYGPRVYVGPPVYYRRYYHY